MTVTQSPDTIRAQTIALASAGVMRDIADMEAQIIQRLLDELNRMAAEFKEMRGCGVTGMNARLKTGRSDTCVKASPDSPA